MRVGVVYMVIYHSFGKQFRVSPQNSVRKLQALHCMYFWLFTQIQIQKVIRGCHPRTFFRTFLSFQCFDPPCTIIFSNCFCGVLSENLLEPFKRIVVCLCYSAYFCLIRGTGQDCRPQKIYDNHLCFQCILSIIYYHLFLKLVQNVITKK